MISPGKHREGKEEVYKRNMEKSEKKDKTFTASARRPHTILLRGTGEK